MKTNDGPRVEVSIPYEVGSIKTYLGEEGGAVHLVSIPYEVGSIKTSYLICISLARKSQSPMKSGRLKRKGPHPVKSGDVSIPYEVGSIKTGDQLHTKILVRSQSPMKSGRLKRAAICAAVRRHKVSIPYEVGSIKTRQVSRSRG